MSANLQVIDKCLPMGSLPAYISWACQIPMLSCEEEYALAKKFKDAGDLEAARKLILSHLRFVIYVTKNYLSYGLPHADLIQEGTIGLMKAVKRFDPDMGVRLISFAVHWIKAEIHEYVLRNWRIVKMATTKAQRKLFFNLRKIARKMGRFGWFTDAELKSVAAALGVKPHEVVDMEIRLNNPDIAFDCGNEEDEDGGGVFSNPASYLSDASATSAEALEQSNWNEAQEKHLSHALALLDARSKDIIDQRWLKMGTKSTLHELAAKYKVSAERIRQLEQNAMLKLKQTIAASM